MLTSAKTSLLWRRSVQGTIVAPSNSASSRRCPEIRDPSRGRRRTPASYRAARMLPSPLDRSTAERLDCSTAERRCDESSERRQTTAGSTHRSGRDTSRAEGELVVRSRLRSVSETVGPHRQQTRRNECSLSLRQLRHSVRMSALSDFLTHATAPWWGAPVGAILGTGLGGWISFASTKHNTQTAQQA